MQKNMFFVFVLLFVILMSTVLGLENIYPKPLSLVSTTVTLEWSGNSSVYQVYLGTSLNNLSLIGESTQTHFTLNGLLPDSIYYWQVIGDKKVSGAITSFETFAKAPILLYPSDESSGISTSSVTLKWSGNGTFKVLMGLSKDKLTQIATVSTSEAKVNNLDPFTKYFWAIAKVGKYSVATSDVISFYTYIPVTPRMKNGAEHTTSRLLLSWTGLPKAVYDVYIGEGTNDMSPLVKGYPLTYIPSELNLKYSQKYYWHVDYTINGIEYKGPIWDFTTASQYGTVSTIQVGKNPGSICMNSKTRMIYVANRGDNTIEVIDGNTDSAAYNTVVATITVGSTPSAICVNPETNMIYVLSRSGPVSVINGNTNKIVSTILTPLFNPPDNSWQQASGPFGTPGRLASETQVYPYNVPAGLWLIKNVYINDTPKSAVVNTGADDGDETWVNGVLANNTNLTACGQVTFDVTKYLHKGWNRIAVLAQNAWLSGGQWGYFWFNMQVDGKYVITDGGVNNPGTWNQPTSVWWYKQILNPTSLNQVGNDWYTPTFGNNPRAITVNPFTNVVYLTNGNIVYVIDGNTDQIITSIPVGQIGQTLDGIAINPKTNMIYVVNTSNNTVSVINGYKNKVVSMVPVG
ncbi:MAG: hypothetical protein QW578_07140, partial [Thermoplasmatales archaeon]